jgi:probable phosphoglycerate mutase
MHPRFFLLLGLLAGLVLLTAGVPPFKARPTTVYIVRHAEKDLNPALKDPPLTPAGESRALALRNELRQRHIAIIFTTNTARTRATATPLADDRKIKMLYYDAKELPALAALIRKKYAGRAVLVVGHSNTILETAEALGAPRPLPKIEDSEFHHLLTVTLPVKGAASATARPYGKVNAVR